MQGTLRATVDKRAMRMVQGRVEGKPMGEAFRGNGWRVLLSVALVGCAASPTIAPEPKRDAGSTGGIGGAGGTAGNGVGGNDLDAQTTGGVAGQASGGAPGEGGQSVTGDCNIGIGGRLWAEASFPGKTADELLRVVAYRPVQTDDQAPNGYSRQMLAKSAIVVRDGYVAAVCGAQGFGGSYSPTFVLP